LTKWIFKKYETNTTKTKIDFLDKKIDFF